MEKVMLREKEVYGILKYYPYNDTAKVLCKIARQKTMTTQTILLVRELGFEVVTDRMSFPPLEQVLAEKASAVQTTEVTVS